ncbi:long-chain acyl-CoA synthetase [Streptomyces sp. IMTB 2501]|uniref:class I adenylate-forming enzyme family protein n=1 Tax=Streptomyces sp. IMTB 2501 TaxID=1776340 RepID=UPI00096D4318|nr:class I adenylate-forming enzyme family protein [Streptomyces sp. IMTB 2501]OLZ73435.1 long-chain acyl-CoA synthetase [Streptomyces sp. IMTB 2501]
MFLQRVANRGIRMGTLFERAAARNPETMLYLDHVLDIYPHLGSRFTVAEVADLIRDISSRLWSVGVRPGSRVAVYKSNNLDVTLLAFAAARIGAVPIPLSSALDAGTTVLLLRRAGRPFLVTDQAGFETLQPHSVVDAVARVVLATGSHCAAVAWDSLAGAERVPAVPRDPHHPTMITHTSGATGTPKLVLHTGASFEACLRPLLWAMAAVVPRRETFAFHIAFAHSRIVTALAFPLLRGFPVVLLAKGAPDHAAEVFARFRPGVVEAHPHSFTEWESLAEDPSAPFASVRLFGCAFDALRPRTVKRLLGASLRRAPIFVTAYGQSEIGPVVSRAFTRRRDVHEEGRCVGLAFPGVTQVRVVSRNGRPPSATDPGHIEVRSDGRARTYVGEDERFEQNITADGWWRMGDVGYRTKWGCLHLLNREVDVIDGFGSTLGAEDQLLSAMAQLTQVVILRAHHELPVPVVCTVDDLPLDTGAWKAASGGLPPMAQPVHLPTQRIPLTGTGKVKRRELAHLLAEERKTSRPAGPRN